MRYTQLNKLGVSTSLPNLLPKFFGLSLPILVCSELNDALGSQCIGLALIATFKTLYIVSRSVKCQKYLPSQQHEPMRFDPTPSRPFEDASADLFSYAGKYYLVYVDRLSGWIKISEFRQDPSSQQVISVLRQYFVDTGVPVRIRTDGGPQFASSKYRQFMKRWGVIPVLCTPHYPQSNGHAEAAVKAMKSLLAKTSGSGDIDSEEFCEGLMEWLNTPKAHGLSPAEVLYGSPLRSLVPAKFKSYSETWKDKFNKLDEAIVALKQKSSDTINAPSH